LRERWTRKLAVSSLAFLTLVSNAFFRVPLNNGHEVVDRPRGLSSYLNALSYCSFATWPAPRRNVTSGADFIEFQRFEFPFGESVPAFLMPMYLLVGKVG
jgi:hypothetical protein